MNSRLAILLVVAFLGIAGANNVKVSTKNLAGLQCLTEAVYSLQDVTDNLEYDVKLCGENAAKTVVYVRDNANDILRIGSKVIDLNINVCNNGAYNEVADAKKPTSQLCFNSVVKQMDKLRKSVRATVREINHVKSSDGCITLNLANLKLDLNDFDKLIRKCADVARRA